MRIGAVLAPTADWQAIHIDVFDWSWDNWPADAAALLAPWRERGMDRFFVSIGSTDMAARVEELAAID